MGFLGNLFKKDAEAQPQSSAVQSAAAEDSFAAEKAKIDRIYDYLLEHYGKPVYRITTQATDNLALTDSKFGGYPYWEPGAPYPCTPGGDPLVLLAQINFAQMQPADDLLPREGLLQIFIQDDDLCGMSFADGTCQDGFRVVFHPQIDPAITTDDVKAQGIKATVDLDRQTSYFPLLDQRALTFAPDQDCININTADFRTAFAAALKDLFDEELTVSPFFYLSKEGYDYFCKKANGWGHKVLGYPCFTQEDPRFDAAEAPEGFQKPTTASFDTVLLQIDSERMDILWGDSGIANFFINSQDLRNRDFSRVLYNWDCY